jgi:hypothetical protein
MVGGIIPLRRATSSRYDGRLGQESAVVMRGHLFRLIYLSAIAVTMFGWIWLMVDIFEWLFTV